MNMPRIIFAAACSGSGKTLITCGILQALINRGLKVASLKCGCDYIDTMFHSYIIGAKTGNLDTFFTDENTVKYLFANNSKDTDISIIEGVMGYYDGIAGIDLLASTYDIAAKTNTPVILIIDAKGMSLSIVALIKGFLEYKSDSKIAGVILNKVSPMIYNRLKLKIEQDLKVKVFGYVPVQKDLKIESRYLGLISPDEIKDLKQNLNNFANTLENTIEIDNIIKLANSCKKLDYNTIKIPKINKKVKIAVAKDAAFSFYYKENLELLKDMGADIINFSPLNDKVIPNVDGIILGGGYPELYVKQLSANLSMRNSIKTAIENQIPCIAECGGFLYLHEFLDNFPMVGCIKGNCYKRNKMGNFGYITLESKKKSILGDCGIKIPAHEFHYYESENSGDNFIAKKPLSDKYWKCIHVKNNLLAGFPHMYFWGNTKAAYNFLKTCEINIRR